MPVDVVGFPLGSLVLVAGLLLCVCDIDFCGWPALALLSGAAGGTANDNLCSGVQQKSMAFICRVLHCLELNEYG